MGEVAVTVIKWVIRSTFIIAGIVAFIVFVNIIVSSLLLGVNGNILTDLMALIQIWLPFNFGIVATYILTLAFAYLTYRMTVYAQIWINRFLGQA